MICGDVSETVILVPRGTSWRNITDNGSVYAFFLCLIGLLEESHLLRDFVYMR